MTYKAKVYSVGTELELEAPDIKTLWKQMAFFQSLPDTCPIDDTPTRLFYKEPEGNSYFSVCNTGQLHLEYKLGQYREGGELFGKGEWWWWDWEKREDVLLCKWGQLTDEGEAMRERLKGSPSVAHKGAQKPQERTNGAQPSNRTAMPRDVAHRLATQPTDDDLNFSLADVPGMNPDGGDNDAYWEQISQEAREAEAADKKAQRPFVWPTPNDKQGMKIAIDLINRKSLVEPWYSIVEAFRSSHADSRGPMATEVKPGKKVSQYGFLVYKMDERYGKDSHYAILSALTGSTISSDNPPGWKCKELVDWLMKPNENADALVDLDGIVGVLRHELAAVPV